MTFLASCFLKHSGKWRTGCGRIFFPALFLCSIILLGFPIAGFKMSGMKSLCEAKEVIPIYFYSSETNINNYKFLKVEFDNYLSQFGSYQFQPFNDRSAFEQYIKNKKQCLLLTSSWHFKHIRKDYQLTPVLAGARKGKIYQKYLLITSTSAGGTIPEPVASAGTLPYTRSLLKEIFPTVSNIDGLRILTVPKDIDALMSVGFQMAKSALTTESALDSLKKLDPVLYKRLNVAAESPPSMLLVVSTPGRFTEGKKLTKILRRMPDNASGVNLLKLLDLDGWKSITFKDLK